MDGMTINHIVSIDHGSYSIGYSSVRTTLSFCQRKAHRLFEQAKFDFPSGKILFPRHEQGSTFLFVDD